ncbi:DUF4192 domain-containing protein [Streptomyces sp. TLI_146]|uniref:DUF4192 domain-containing protein n=1 Tax=Streptomyces sp. TLI_146 TaxID=1938858 RepID=UPI000C71367B|nr:DUF4192 domain-containing protein [Streptomyces sp. TLI_146]PKV88416.1 uncharacterized protein DUF4192 [Streptomyces sp. TLI_146]
MNKHHESHGSHGLPDDDPQLTLRSPAELADALPYLMGFHPTDSIVMVALHGRRGRFGGRLRLGIPRAPGEWPHVAEQLAECLMAGSERRGPRPDGIIVFLCQDPEPGSDMTSSQVMERLRPLAQLLRTACGALDVPVLEALCISDGRYWSYCCPDARCCPPEGNVLAMAGTSVLAAAATFAGLQVRGSLREMEARLAPWRRPAAADQERVLAAAEEALVPRILDEEERLRVGRETLDLAGRVMRRLSGAPPATGRTDADALDDALIAHDEAAALVLGLQDRTTRDRAAEWMEGPDAAPAQRLWRALARRCVGRYGEHAAAPLTLAGWVAWSTGDEPAARVALGLALRADPEYQFAQLLHQACNRGLDPEALRRCLREERREREEGGAAAAGGAVGEAGLGGSDRVPALGAEADVAEPAAAERRVAVEASASGVGGPVRRLRSRRKSPAATRNEGAAATSPANRRDAAPASARPEGVEGGAPAAGSARRGARRTGRAGQRDGTGR